MILYLVRHETVDENGDGRTSRIWEHEQEQEQDLNIGEFHEFNLSALPPNMLEACSTKPLSIMDCFSI